MKRFALIGHNIGYSLSPLVHRAIYNRFGVSATYEILSIAPERLSETVERLKTYDGFNVTKPYKIDVIRYIDKDMSGIGSVNTVAVERGFMTGYTTDGFGFSRHLELVYGSPAGKTCLVLGAGGVARIIVPELKKAGAEVVIYNRTPERGRLLAEEFGCKTFAGERPNIIVNCTSCGLHSGENPLPDVELTKLEFAYDTIYAPPVTDFMTACAPYARTENGLGMLILQAIKADEIMLKLDVMSDILSLYTQVKTEVEHEIAHS